MTDMLLGIVNFLIFIVQWVVIPITVTWWAASEAIDKTKDGDGDIKTVIVAVLKAAIVGGILFWAVGAMKNIVPWIGSGINDTLDFGMILDPTLFII